MTSKTRAILIAAVLATPVAMFASPRIAVAQYRVNNSGALDANNRIGSGGVNEARPTNTINGNDIVTGNVTAGREFRGNVGYSSAGAFQGSTGVNQSDRFIRGSSSAYDSNAQAVRPFYGQSYGAPPPQGFVSTPGSVNASGQYIPAQPLDRTPGDLRLGQVTDFTSSAALPRPREFMLPGQVDAGNSQSLVTASPLYGVRSDQGDMTPNAANAAPGFATFNRNNMGGKKVDDKAIQNMRDELRKNVISNDPNDSAANPSVDPNDLNSKSVIQSPYESPEATSLNSKSLGSPLTGGKPLAGNIKTDQSQTNALVPAPQQSTQYAELSRRFKGLQNSSPTDQQVQSQFNHDLKARKEAKIKADSKLPGLRPGMPGVRPGAGGGSMIPAVGGSPDTVVPGTVLPGDTPPDSSPTAKPTPKDPVKVPDTGVVDPPVAPVTRTEKPEKPDAEKGPALNIGTAMIKPGQPLMVRSLTEGMKPGGLKDTLATAEDQMRKGKYTSALDQYDLAERVAPNNPLITLGRANAELGASKYASSESSIRRAYAADPALLLGQFELATFLGRDRLDFLEKDLKDITTTEPKSVGAPFLLAYLKYNAGDLKMASNYLALSEKRAGKNDPLYKQMRIYWALPAADPIPDSTPEMNK